MGLPPSVKASQQHKAVLEQRWYCSRSQISGWETGDPVPRLVLHHLSTTVSRTMFKSFHRPEVGASHQQRGQKTSPGDSVWIWTANQTDISESLPVLAGLLAGQCYHISYGRQIPVCGYQHLSPWKCVVYLLIQQLSINSSLGYGGQCPTCEAEDGYMPWPSSWFMDNLEPFLLLRSELTRGWIWVSPKSASSWKTKPLNWTEF